MDMQLQQGMMAYDHLDVDELMSVTSRLTDLLNMEVEYLEAMNIGATEQLQVEKTALTQVLEAQKQMIQIHPELIDDISDTQRDELSDIAYDFKLALERNIRLVAVAKAVNGRVVQAILDTLQEQNSIGVYTKSGVAAAAPQHGISLTLNQQA